MIKISVSQVIEINKTVISKTGGTFTILNEDLLEQSVNSIYQTFDGNELYPNILDKASQICYSLCKNHCFEDGNKRTALVTMLVLLDINGYNINNLNHNSMYNLIYNVAEGSSNKNNITEWLYKYIKEI